MLAHMYLCKYVFLCSRFYYLLPSFLFAFHFAYEISILMLLFKCLAVLGFGIL